MSEYIKREDVLKSRISVLEHIHGIAHTMFVVTVQDINDVPAADVEPVVRGEWKWEPPYTICSVCGRHSINRFQSKYCQHCGAKMNNPRGAHMERSGSGEK